MGNSKAKSDNGGLIALLCVLGVVIVGLVAGVIIMGVGKKTEETPEVSESQRSYEEYAAYVDEYEATIAKAQELFQQRPVDVEAIIKMYTERVNNSISKKDIDRAGSYLEAEIYDLLDGGFKQEALDVLTGMDLEVFDESRQHFWYEMIISLAGDLNEDEIAQRYEPLWDATKAAYDASLAGTEAAAEAFEAIKIKYDDQGETE